MSVFSVVPTASVPVYKLSKDGIPSLKSLDYAINCKIGGNGYIELTLSEFSKNGKAGKAYVTVNVDSKGTVSIKTFEMPNTKGYLAGKNHDHPIVNLTLVVLTDYLKDAEFNHPTYIGMGTDQVNVDQSYLLFNALLPLFQSELTIDDLKKSGVTKKITSLTEKQIYDAWLTVNSSDDVIVAIQNYIKRLNSTQTPKPATK